MPETYQKMNSRSLRVEKLQQLEVARLLSTFVHLRFKNPVVRV